MIGGGPIFKRYDWGAYLIWSVYPKERVFIDGRADVYALPDDRLVRDYLESYLGKPNCKEPLDRYAVSLVLIEPESPLTDRLKRDSEWYLAYSDSQAVIYRRSGTNSGHCCGKALTMVAYFDGKSVS